jgi:SAM-dependent methyltransferase
MGIDVSSAAMLIGLGKALRSGWRWLPPAWRIGARGLPGARRIRALLLRRMPAIYDEEYYAEVVEPTARRSAPVIAGSIVRDLNPSSILDVGCGTGAILFELRARGVRTRGFEYSEAARAYCRARQLDVSAFDLARDQLPSPQEPYDVVISTEVAEHLPSVLADRFVEVLVSHGRVIVLTAATPGQGGLGHVNEQPHSYWVERFAARGWGLDHAVTSRWRDEWAASPEVAAWYAANVMVFHRTPDRYAG